jgi:hypothetical protein
MLLATIMDLFTEGTVAPIEAPDGKIVTIWVNKLSPFEKEDADRLGRGARAKRLLEWDADEDEQAVFTLETKDLSDDDLVQGLAAQNAAAHFYQAINEIRTLEEWKERLEYLNSAEVLEYTSPEATEDDRALYEKINREYSEAIEATQRRLADEFCADLAAQGREKVLEQYHKAWRDAEGMKAFYAERQIAELFFATRECKAKAKGKVGEDTIWDHAKCNHEVRVMSNRGQVRSLPDVVRTAVVAALQALEITPDAVGNSDAPTASSESSEQPSSAEVSTPSTPEATSDEPAGI